MGSKTLKNWIPEKIKGINMPRSDPIMGIKLRIKVKTPNAGAKSLFKKNKTMNVKKPVKKLVNDFIWK